MITIQVPYTEGGEWLTKTVELIVRPNGEVIHCSAWGMFTLAALMGQLPEITVLRGEQYRPRGITFIYKQKE